MWRSNNSAVTYSNWENNNPNKNNKEACAILDTNNGGQWDDHECDHDEDGYICEAEIGMYYQVLYITYGNVKQSEEERGGTLYFT